MITWNGKNRITGTNRNGFLPLKDLLLFAEHFLFNFVTFFYWTVGFLIRRKKKIFQNGGLKGKIVMCKKRILLRLWWFFSF